MTDMNPYEAVHLYVEIIARQISPFRFRLRKYETEAQADIIRIATERVTNRGLPAFINPPDSWLVFQRPLKDGRTVLLVHRALDSARKEYNDSTARSLGPKPGEAVSKDAEVRLSRFTEFGQVRANEPTVALERAKAQEIEHRAPEIQAAEHDSFLREAEVENKRYRRELDAYEELQTKRGTALQRKKHLEAVQLLRRGLSYAEIGKLTCNSEGKLGLSERILKPHHDALVAISNRHRHYLWEIAERSLLTDDDGLPYTACSSLPSADPSDDTMLAEESSDVPPWETVSEVPIERGETVGRDGDAASFLADPRASFEYLDSTDSEYCGSAKAPLTGVSEPTVKTRLYQPSPSTAARLRHDQACWEAARKVRFRPSMPPFGPGDAVQHPRYGFGVVMCLGGTESSPTARVWFQDGAAKWVTAPSLSPVKPFGDPEAELAELDRLCDSAGWSLDKLLRTKENPA